LSNVGLYIFLSGLLSKTMGKMIGLC
jgi:hypothetical protein